MLKAVVCVESTSVTYGSGQSEYSLCDGWDISLLPQIYGLEQVLTWYSIGSESFLESLDVLHDGEGLTFLVNLLH